jgi:hypothetical protein
MRSTPAAVDKCVRKMYVKFSAMWNVFWNVGFFLLSFVLSNFSLNEKEFCDQ